MWPEGSPTEHKIGAGPSTEPASTRLAGRLRAVYRCRVIRRYLGCIEHIDVSRPLTEAEAFITDIGQLCSYELKADEVQVRRAGPDSGVYTVKGRFARLPWTDTFTYRLHGMGFHSWQERERPSGLEISGGFVVAPLGHDRSRVIHYEEYAVPVWAIPLRPLIAAYLRRSMIRELQTIRGLIEARSGVANSVA